MHEPAQPQAAGRCLLRVHLCFVSAGGLVPRVATRGCTSWYEELAERNAALTRSLAENDHMRGALQQIIDSMPCGVLVLDTAQTVVTINPEGRRLLQLGDARGTRCGRSCAELHQLEALTAACEGQSARRCVWRRRASEALAGDQQPKLAAQARDAAGNSRRALQSIWIFRDITA